MKFLALSRFVLSSETADLINGLSEEILLNALHFSYFDGLAWAYVCMM